MGVAISFHDPRPNVAVLLPAILRSLSCPGTNVDGFGQFKARTASRREEGDHGTCLLPKVENCWKCLELGKYEQAQEARMRRESLLGDQLSSFQA